MPSTVALYLAAEEAGHASPIPPIGVFAIFATGFLLLLAVTWAFRGNAHKYAPPSGDHGGAVDVHHH